MEYLSPKSIPSTSSDDEDDFENLIQKEVNEMEAKKQRKKQKIMKKQPKLKKARRDENVVEISDYDDEVDVNNKRKRIEKPKKEENSKKEMVEIKKKPKKEEMIEIKKKQKREQQRDLSENYAIYNNRNLWDDALETINIGLVSNFTVTDFEIAEKIDAEFKNFRKYTPFNNTNRSTKIENVKVLANELIRICKDTALVYTWIGKYFKNKSFKNAAKNGDYNYPKIYGDNFHRICHPIAKLAMYRSRKKGLKYDVIMSDELYSYKWLFNEDGFIPTEKDMAFLRNYSADWAPVLGCIINYAELIKKEALMPFGLCRDNIAVYVVDYFEKNNYDLRSILMVEQAMLETEVSNTNVMNAEGYVGRVNVGLEKWIEGVIRYMKEVATKETTITFIIDALKYYEIIPATYPWTYSINRPEMEKLDTHILHVGPKCGNEYPQCTYQPTKFKVKDTSCLDQRKLIKNHKTLSHNEFLYDGYSVIVVQLQDHSPSPASVLSSASSAINKVVNVELRKEKEDNDDEEELTDAIFNIPKM